MPDMNGVWREGHIFSLISWYGHRTAINISLSCLHAPMEHLNQTSRFRGRKYSISSKTYSNIWTETASFLWAYMKFGWRTLQIMVQEEGWEKTTTKHLKIKSICYNILFSHNLHLHSPECLGTPLNSFMRNMNKYTGNLLVAFQMDEKARY